MCAVEGPKQCNYYQVLYNLTNFPFILFSLFLFLLLFHCSFSKEAKEARHPCAFMPFGSGPRICVARRFAILEGKIGLARLLKKFNFELNSKTPVSVNEKSTVSLSN